MSQLRFNHVFTSLVLLCALCAFVIPTPVTNGFRSTSQRLFSPVAMPVRKLTLWAKNGISPAKPIDLGGDGMPRSDATLLTENNQLRTDVANLTEQLKELQRLNADRQMLGDVRPYCTPFAVAGNDSSQRQSLELMGSSFDGLAAGMPVLYQYNIVGKLDRAGIGGATVRLITDKGFRVTAQFGRLVKDPQGHTRFAELNLPPKLIEGDGKGGMTALFVYANELASSGLATNDWVVLRDTDGWPSILQGRYLGRVVSTGASDKPLFASVKIEPATNLLAVPEVAVLNKGK